MIATFSFIAEVSGVYRLETFLLDKNLTPARYDVKVETLRSATPIATETASPAKKAELEGNLVVDHNATLEGRLLQIAKYETSLSLWRELGDRKNELRLLRTIGSLYRPHGDPPDNNKILQSGDTDCAGSGGPLPGSEPDIAIWRNPTLPWIQSESSPRLSAGERYLRGLIGSYGGSHSDSKYQGNISFIRRSATGD